MKDTNNLKEKYSKDMNKQFTEEKTHIAKKTNEEIFELPGGQRNTNQDHKTMHAINKI